MIFPDLLLGGAGIGGGDRLLGIGGLQRQEEADELVIALGELERLFPRPDLGGDAVQIIPPFGHALQFASGGK